MSHSRERTEKNCLNCNTQVYGRYCHVCGQENLDPHESFWSLTSHFFNDFTHFDGKFFKTIGYLVTKPGKLPQEYMAGRRASFLHPIRMYIFSSAIFFLIIYSMSSLKNIEVGKLAITDSTDSRIPPYVDPMEIKIGDSTEGAVSTRIAYDSIQKTLPANKRDGWLSRRIMYKNIEINRRFSGDSRGMINKLLNGFVHTFPSLLFLTLPLSALFLKLLYFKNRNNLYAGHVVFLLYLYVFTFVLLLAYFGLEELKVFKWSLIGWLQAALVIYSGVYALQAMKRFYDERWGRTIFKFFIWNLLALIIIVVLFVVFFLFTLLTV